jgi:hypothetical protein
MLNLASDDDGCRRIRACGEGGNSEPGRAVADATPPFVAMLFEKILDGRAMLSPQALVLRNAILFAAEVAMPPKRARGRPFGSGRGGRSSTSARSQSNASSSVGDDSDSGSSSRSYSRSGSAVSQYTHTTRHMTAEALLCYTAGIGQRLTAKVSALDFDQSSAALPDGLVHSAAVAADVARVFARHYDCVTDAIDQLVAVEVVLARRCTEAQEDIRAPVDEVHDVSAQARGASHVGRRGGGRRGRGRNM